jgi:hypothetical protein
MEKIESRANLYCNFYLIVVVATIGSLMSSRVPFTVHQSIALTLGLFGFFAGNFGVIRSATKRIEALEAEIMAQSAQARFTSEALKANLSTRAMWARIPASYAIHVVIDAGVDFSIWTKLA